MLHMWLQLPIIDSLHLTVYEVGVCVCVCVLVRAYVLACPLTHLFVWSLEHAKRFFLKPSRPRKCERPHTGGRFHTFAHVVRGVQQDDTTHRRISPTDNQSWLSQLTMSNTTFWRKQTQSLCLLCFPTGLLFCSTWQLAKCIKLIGEGKITVKNLLSDLYPKNSLDHI